MSDLHELRVSDDDVQRIVWFNGERVEKHCVSMLASGWQDDEVDGWVELIKQDAVSLNTGEFTLFVVRKFGRVKWQYKNE